MIRWDPTPQDAPLLDRVIDRIKAGPKSLDNAKTDMAMSVTAAHLNGCPLDLERMLTADDGDFWHDVAGINRHLDRSTGKLKDFFVPRFARRPEVTA